MKQIYFSPTGTTKKVVQAIGKAWKNDIEDIDITSGIESNITVPKENIAIIGVPVYSGRIPLNAELGLNKITGKNTPVITIVVYGNRDYDDALLELNDSCTKQGFKVIASAAFIGTHSFDQTIAAGRPNERDLNIANNLGRSVKYNLEDQLSTVVKVKGNSPYRERNIFPHHPIANEACDFCGQCVELCPMGAISKENLKTSDPKLCISCMLCARECPQQARHLDMPPEDFEKLIEGLNSKCEGVKQPELFF